MQISLFRPAVFLLLCACPLLAQRPGGFQVIGPGGGGAQYNPTVSPHDPGTVLLSCDMTGAYISQDAGKSWRMFNLRGVVKFFVFDPLNPKTIYAETTGLWRSEDGGTAWKLIWPRPETVHNIEMASDHADEELIADPNPVGTITALAIDPKESHTLWAAAKNRGESAVWLSHDDGATWSKEGTLSESANRLWYVADTLYAAGPHGLQIRKLGGAWEKAPAPEGITFLDVSAGFTPSGEPTIYAAAEQGVYVSRDSGATWHKGTLPGTGARIPAVATSLRHPETAYLSYAKLSIDGKKWFGMARTTDGGETWSLVWKEDSKTADPNIHDAWITPRFGPEWGENPLTLGVDQNNPKLVYATDLGRTLQSTDGGKNWNAVYSRRLQGGEWTTTGLDVTTSYGYHFDPFDQRRQFITYTDIGLFRSEDGGHSWQSSTAGVPPEWLNTTYWVEFDPEQRGRMWAANSGTHDLPRPKMWRRTATARYKGGISISNDGGRTWKTSNEGMPQTAPTHILLDPKSPRNARVLYASTMGYGIFKSIDSGATWTAKNEGITQTNPLAWRLARAGDGALYALIARRSEDGGIGNAGDGALYKSTDGANNWTPVALPTGANAPNGLAVDPKDPQRLYLATWARKAGMHGEGGGIWLSTDAGKTWRSILSQDQHVYDVTIDPKDPATLYASGFESSAWRSTDRGENWRRIAGYNFKWGHRVIPDPSHPGSVYITTFGGSVWHGAVTEETGAPLDIDTPALSPGQN